MNLLDLFEAQQHPAYANLDALQQAVKTSRDATVDFGGGSVTVEYPLARYILSRYQAQQTGADRGRFLAALADARKFDAISSEYRQLADKAQLEEQYQGTPKAIGTAFLGLILKHQKDPMPVLIDFEDGQQAFRLTTPEVKDWFIRAFESYRRRGKESQFLEFMGTREGFGKLVSRFITDKAKLERERLGITPQKKRTSVAEADTENVRTQRIIDKLRIQQPQAKSDMEALVYSFLDAQEKDQAAIDRLEKEIDTTEKSVKSDLQKSLDRLKGRGAKAREKLSGVTAADERQDALLKKIVALDREQSQAIDDLEKEVGGLSKSTSPVMPAASKTTAPVSPDQTGPEQLHPVQFGTMARQLTEPIKMKAPKRRVTKKSTAKTSDAATVTTPSADIRTFPGTIGSPEVARQLSKSTAAQMTQAPAAAAQAQALKVADIKTARARRDAEKIQPDLFGQQQSRKQQVANLEEQDVIKPRLTRIHYFRVNPNDADLAEKAGLRQDRSGNWALLQYDKSGSIFNQKMAQAVRMFGQPAHTEKMMETDDVEARFNAAMSGKAWNPPTPKVEPTAPVTPPMAQTGSKPWPAGADEEKFDQYLNSDRFKKDPRIGSLNTDRLKDVFRTAPDHQKAELLRQIKEGLRRGEYHEATVTFDDGSKETVKITSDEGFRDQIAQHFAKQGRKVTDIDVDWSVKRVNEAEKKPKPTNPQLWGRAKSAARSKFDVYPSAYANAWAAKWYKQHGGGWR